MYRWRDGNINRYKKKKEKGKRQIIIDVDTHIRK